MTHTDLFEWQFANDLDDAWWVFIAGTTGSRLYTLSDIRILKEQSPHSSIRILHQCFSNEEEQEWIEYELEQNQMEDMLSFAAPEKAVFHKPYQKWNATLPLMVRLAVSAVGSLNHTVTNVNDAIGLVSFETKISWGSWSGLTCILQITEHEPNWFTVSGNGKQNIRGGQMIALDLGEAASVTKKVIAKMADLAR